MTVENEALVVEAKLTKYEEGTTTRLADATFGNEVIQTDLKTDENGELVVRDLEAGDYSFVETAAPNGYKLDAIPIPFSIVKSQQEFVNIAVSNVMLDSPEELPPSGEIPREAVTPSPQEVTGNHVVTQVGSQALPVIIDVKTTEQKWSAQRLPTAGDTRNEPLIWIG